MIDHAILIGNTFPLALIRRNARIEISSLEELKQVAANCRIISFWGHANTLEAVEQWSGLPLHPKEERPSLQLDEDKNIIYAGSKFRECWVISPDYLQRYRHAIGEEMHVDGIVDWQVLHITLK